MGELRAQRRIEPQPDSIDDVSLDLEPEPVVAEEAPAPLELVSDQSTEEVERNRQEVVRNTMRTLDRYRAHLQLTHAEITSNLEQLTSWYHKFTDRYKQQKASYERVGNALDQVSALMSTQHEAKKKAQEKAQEETQQEVKTPTEYDTAKNAQVELFKLQEELHESGIVPFTEKMGTIEIAPDAPEMDWKHADALGKSMEIKEAGESIVECQMAGFAKKHDVKKVGEYGQDSAIVNPAAGVMVQIDGSTTLGPESYRAGIVYGEKVHDILRGIPESESNPAVIEEYVRKRYKNEMQTVLDWMPQNSEEAGGAVMVAMRVLPEVGLVVAFRIGDGHMAMKQGEETIAVLPAEKPRPGSAVRGVGIMDAGAAGIKVMNAEPSVAVYQFDPFEDLELFAVSDGLDKMPGKPTVTDVLKKGGVKEIEQMGKPPRPIDDMLAVHLQYKGR